MSATGQLPLVSSAQALKRDLANGESVVSWRSRSTGRQKGDSVLVDDGGHHIGGGGTGIGEDFDKRKSDSVPPE